MLHFGKNRVLWYYYEILRFTKNKLSDHTYDSKEFEDRTKILRLTMQLVLNTQDSRKHNTEPKIHSHKINKSTEFLLYSDRKDDLCLESPKLLVRVLYTR